MTATDHQADQDSFAARAHRFHTIHGGHALEPFADNMHGRTALLESGGAAMPVLVSDGDFDSAWTCSPRVTYSEAASEEAGRNLPPLLRAPARGLASATGRWLTRAGLDRVVAVNHWLLSTDLHPPASSVPVAAMLGQTLQRWPGHVPWFRSLNVVDNVDWLETLAGLGFDLVASRQVYLYADIPKLVARHGDLKRDLALLGRTPLRRAGDQDIGEADYARIAMLYGQLYLDKYSRLNPRYSEQFIRLWHQSGLLELHGFRDPSGSLLCVIGLFRQGSTLSAPIVGYDTALPQKLGLYRLLTACAYEVAGRNGYRLNFSAGAAHFKRLRGGEPAIEYSAFYTRHLPKSAGRAVRILSQLSQRVGVPLLKRYQL